MQQFKKKFVVIYHGGCSDGFGGAWAAWKKFGTTAHYYGASHSEPPLDYLRGKEIYLVDFSYPPAVIKKLLKNNPRVTAIDHHVSAEWATKMTQDYRYALNRSGCVLAWKYFHPKKPVPRLLRYIEDIDLWRFTMAKTREVRSWLGLSDQNFRSWDRFVRLIERPATRRKCIAEGAIVVRAEEAAIRHILGSAVLVNLAGYRAVAVNAQEYTANFVDYLAHAAMKRAGVAVAAVWRETKNHVRVSLRSDGTADASRIAARFGGGGHAVSSGFDLPPGKPFPWKRANR